MPQEAENLRVSGLSWRIDARVKDSHLVRMLREGRDPLRLDHEIVKSNPHRRVLRIETNGSAFYLKQHVYSDRQERLRRILLPSRAKAEWNAIHRMRALGFHTPEPVAYAQGATASGRTSILVTRALEEGLNLKEAIESLTPRRGLQLARSLGAQFRVLHDRGVYHRDAQPGNIFACTQGNGFKFYFLDLHKAVFTASVSGRRRVKDLGQLAFNMLTFCDSAVIVALLSGYAGGQPRKMLVERVMRRARRLATRRKRSRARRCLRNSTHFTVERVGRFRIFHRREIAAATLANLVERGRYSGDSHVCTVPAGQGRPALHVKRIQSGSLYQNLKDLFQRPRGRRAWHAANALVVRGIPTPRPLALVEERRAGLLRHSYLVTEFVPSTLTLAQYAHSEFVMKEPPPGRLREFARCLARALAPLYGEGIYHGDLKASNILVCDGPGADPEFSFSDLDGIQLWRRPTASRIVKNLVQLYCSLPLCVAAPLAARFFIRFLRETGLGPKLRSRLPEIIRRARARRAGWIAVVRKYGRIL